MRIRVLADNSARPGFRSEWGLSMALTLDNGRTWLWDAGQTGLFLESAAALGVDVPSLAGLALSHGHYDHTGGLDALYDAGFHGPVFAHEDIILTRYNCHGEEREIGIPGLIPEFVKVRGSSRLDDGLTLVTDIPRLPGNVQAVDGFFFDREQTRPDAVRDDAFLVLETKKGPVLVLGCCHSGLANTLAAAEDRLGLRAFHAVLGGLHLYGGSRRAWEQAAQALERTGATLIAAGHCTGDEAQAWLKTRLPGRTQPGLASGMVFEF